MLLDRGEQQEARRQRLRFIFDAVWLDDKRVIAVQSTKSFARFFASGHVGRKARCVKSGSDGTRTRDLRRDRPAF
jgi:hypothetical protein